MKTEKMVYTKSWGSAPDGSKVEPSKNYKLSSIPEITVLSRYPDGSPKTVHFWQSVPYMGGDDRVLFWPNYDLLPGCIPAVLEAGFRADVVLEEGAQNIRGYVLQLINDVDEWSYSVNLNRQDGSSGWGSRTRIELDAARVLTPGANSFGISGSIAEYECWGSCCSRQPNLGTWINIDYDLPPPGSSPTPGPGGSGDPNGSPDPNASPSDGSGGSGSPGPGGSGDPNVSPSPGSSGDPNGGGDGDGSGNGGDPGSGSPSPSPSASISPSVAPSPTPTPTATPTPPILIKKEQFEGAVANLTNKFAGDCEPRSAYRLNGVYDDALEARDRASYWAADQALYGETHELRVQGFLMFAALQNIPMTPQEAATLAAGYAAGKIIVAGAPVILKSAADLIPPSFRDRIAKKTCGLTTAKGHGLDAGVWGLPPLERGTLIEQALGRSDDLPFSFPVIDKFENGLATSIKTMDLDAASYQVASKLRAELNKHVKALDNFNGTTWQGATVDGADITGKALDIAIPRLPSPAQQAVFNEVIAAAAQKGISIRIFVFP